MAAIDAAFGWIFSYPDASDPEATGGGLPPEAPFYTAPRPAPSLLAFADVAAGPGGFSEYLLWRRGASALGLGFTLRGTHDFTLHKFHYKSLPELFHPCAAPAALRHLRRLCRLCRLRRIRSHRRHLRHLRRLLGFLHDCPCRWRRYYGPNDDGDLYTSSNLRALQALTDRQTDGQRLHVVMGDGGFDVSGAENIQEVLNKQLLLTQVMMPLPPIPRLTARSDEFLHVQGGAVLSRPPPFPHPRRRALPPSLPPCLPAAVCVRGRSAAARRPLCVQGLRPVHTFLGGAALHHAPMLRASLRVRRCRPGPASTHGSSLLRRRSPSPLGTTALLLSAGTSRPRRARRILSGMSSAVAFASPTAAPPSTTSSL